MPSIEIDLTGAKELAKGLEWLSSLGENDTEKIRGELQDLLFHCSQTLKSHVQLTEVLYKIKKSDFNKDSFLSIYFHCTENYSSPDAARKARSHCTDIQRDIERIKFKLAKVLRSELGKWNSVDDGFGDLLGGDINFLQGFEANMKLLQNELDEILKLIDTDMDEAWLRYENLRTTLFTSIKNLRDEIQVMEGAEDYIRRMLT